ncbi:hypothetical protein BCR32DRAFT_327459 [Anaeromyces robustus]|uniref:Coth-domain-containing protein n=1 Tax=Anaeromyces robustus TaxID=1754192 RepID=A0A1Y1X5V3_9FUNG|nr:hypothetical protein BCR32DRAFT_327459 [Anaeromyces robustus]|eukprot:ORX81038.1 hypothetical protein BCR32DRAFT_327459 [Anaeromyces robustus]
MKSSLILYLCIFTTLFTWASACIGDDLPSYVKHLNRTFNPLEGKIVTIKFNMPESKYNTLIETAQISSYDLFYQLHMDFNLIPTFEEKVNMTTIIDGEEEVYEKVNFKIGGRFARVQDRIGFNIKLKKDKLFYQRRDLRLRPDALDYTHIRSKISADLMNRWGLPSVQETYAKVYVNNHYYGLYFLMDAVKPFWIRQVYGSPEMDENGEDDVKTLYHCQSYNSNLDPVNIQKCFNEKDEYLDYTEPLYSMVNHLMTVTNIEQLGQIFDIDHFYRMIIAEYLFAAYDNFLIMGHNYHLYQKPDGTWDIIDHDYDSNFGVNIDMVLGGYIPLNFTHNLTYDQYVNAKFDDWYADEKKTPIIDILYYDNKSRFVRILREMLVTGFNPDELFPRIDKLSSFVEPFVREDIVPNEDGILPGRVNLLGNPSNHTMEMFYNNTAYDMINTYPGLKDFIQKKFDAVCRNYNLNKNEILRDALFYRTQIAIKNKMDEINEKMEQQRQIIEEKVNSTKEKLQESITKTLNDLSSLLGKLGKK